jgi:hypothetical protein
MSARHPKPPGELGSAGRALWRRLHGALDEGLRFSVHELEVLERACVLADREERLRTLLDDGLTIAGSRGQTILHPAVAELRLVEAQLVGLLQRISLEDTAGQVQTPRHRRAVRAARTRWDRERDELASKRKAAGLDG